MKNKLCFIEEKLVKARPLKPLGLPLLKKRSKTIAWVCGELRKFSQFACELAVLITKYPYENEFSTDILLFVLRKSNLWFDFLKFTFAVRSRFVSNMATCRVANHRF